MVFGFDPLQRETDYVYDYLHWRSEVYEGDPASGGTVDGQGDPLGPVTSYGYDPLGNVLTVIRDRLGRVAPGDCSPGAPTDPDGQDYRIRFLG